MTYTERPGVYASYEVSGVNYSDAGAAGIVAVAAKSASGESGKVVDITSYNAAVSEFGSGCAMTELVKILLQNGVMEIKAVSVGTAGAKTDYEDAFEAIAAVEDVSVVVCDSRDAEIHTLLKNSIMNADEKFTHRIGVVESAGDVTALVNAAKAINCERIVLAAPCISGDGNDGCIAAAVAGAIARQSDPAIPLNGAELAGVSDLESRYNDGDITLLVRGGVTPVEKIGGSVSVVRGVTTRTKTGDTADATWRELSTVLIVDNVVPAIRNSLKNMFMRKKNTAQTRGAIRTQVMVELEKKLTAEIIDGYDNISVTQNGSDPTVCDVSFDFAVTHGLNQIRISAFITV